MMQHSTTTTMSSSASAANKRGRGVVSSSLQGPRPLPLSLPPAGTASSSPPLRPSKRPRFVNDEDDVIRARPAAPGPVILYEYTPKVIHARPDEFKALVQRLTGRNYGTAGGSGDQDQEAVLFRPAQTTAAALSASSQQEQDPLVLTLGQQQVLPPLLIADRHTPPVLPPSPGGAAGGFLLSPGSFLFSPATMQAIQELIS